MSQPFTVSSEHKVDLRALPTVSPANLSREAVEQETKALGEELGTLQELLFYAGQHSLLVVLQGMDTSGKDGTIRHLLNCTNVQSTRVVPFKVPTLKELSHDFLWRCHHQVPGKGEVVVFNRSHYEDVLVVRVHELVPKEVWSKRFGHINDFEKLLADSGTIIVKFFLHISNKEQEERLLDREQELEKAWKLNVGDWKEREFWNDYQQAYEDALGGCASKRAPWHIVPADHKWYRNYVVTRTLVETLRPFEDDWKGRLQAIGDKAKAELSAYRSST